MPTLVRKDRFLWEIFPEIKVLSAEIRVRKYTYNRREILVWAKMAYVRELYLDLIIAVNWVPTKEQIADLLTKPLDKTTFLSLRTLLMTGSNEVP